MLNQESSRNNRRVNFRDTFERNFITYGGAFKEFLLKPSQLEGLPKYFRRSPYETEISIAVFNRKDVEKRAIEIWGSLEKLEKEKSNREQIKNIEEQYNSEIKKTLRDVRRENSMSGTDGKLKTYEPLVVALALFVDILNVVFKLIVWFYTNSDSLIAETIHSIADTLNQSILVIGLFQIAQKPNTRHPYGYSNTMYVASLISGVGIFCLGAAVTIFIGVLSLTSEHTLIYKDIKWALVVLAFSTTTDFCCFCFTILACYRASKQRKTKCLNYAFQGLEPGVTVILLEDSAAVLGNCIAAIMLFISWELESYIPDAIGSIAIGCLLGSVALFLIITNSAALVGRSIPQARLEDINKVLESDVMIRAIYDVKGIDIGNNLVRYKAEIDFDGAELSRLYLDHLNLEELLEQVLSIKNIDNLETFMVTHGENIVDLLGSQIDRIEMRVRELFPEVRHVDLEIL